MQAKLIEIHMIQSHPPSNLNRDWFGAPKTAYFGGYPRVRVSSQCLKRSIRRSAFFLENEALKDHISIRTKTFPDLVYAELEKRGKAACEAGKEPPIPDGEWVKVRTACINIGKSDKRADGLDEGGEDQSQEENLTKQVIPLGPTEVTEFVAALERLRGTNKEDYRKFITPSEERTTATGRQSQEKVSKDFFCQLQEAYKHDAIDIALFGRMVTSDALENVEASMQAAHAISTHEAQIEVDYFTAVDDLPGARKGAAHVDESQFTSATFYKYFSLHWKGLVDNLLLDPASASTAEKKSAQNLAVIALRAFIDAACKVVPSGKRNSYGNNNPPDCVLVEVKEMAVPTSYANAFVAPARARADRDGEQDIVRESIRMLGQYSAEVARGFKIPSQRFWYVTRDLDKQAPFPPVDPGDPDAASKREEREKQIKRETVTDIPALIDAVLDCVPVPMEGK